MAGRSRGLTEDDLTRTTNSRRTWGKKMTGLIEQKTMEAEEGGVLAKLLGGPPPAGEEVAEQLDDDEAAGMRHLSLLPYPKDGIVFQVLEARFKNGDIYSYSALGSLVVSNPFRAVPCLANPEEQVNEFKTPLTQEDLNGKTRNMETCGEPHIWALCRDAWSFQTRYRRSVSFIIQGESGAGKTETAKHVMLYFSSGPIGKEEEPIPAGSMRRRASVRGRKKTVHETDQGRFAIAIALEKGAGEGKPKASIQDVMMCANPLTEALGNAKTPRNDNSSRFGRFVKLFMSPQGEVTSSEISIYSLEKSRVVLQGPGDRNFHVFYQILSGVTDEQRKKHKLRNGPSDYKLLTRKETVQEVPGMDDGAEWEESVVPALEAIGVEDDILGGFIDMLSATLLCGEVVWEGDEATTSTPQMIDDVAELLGVEPALLLIALSTKKRKMPRGSDVQSPLTPKQADESTQSLSRAVYECLFAWIVGHVNTMARGDRPPTKPGDEDAAGCWIGVLDIFGFEAFKMNSLEQLFINYTNERLHQFFIDAVYKRELALCKEEGISVSFSFEDNSNILEAIDSGDITKGLGIFNLLEEQSGLASGSSEAFTVGCHKRFKSHQNKCYVEPKVAGKERFEIKHSCCLVVYTTAEFREKNMDMMLPDVRTLLLNSKSELVRSVVALGPEVAVSGPKRAYVAGQFMKSVNQLFVVLRSSEPRFVKCVKSNPQKKPYIMDKDLVHAQLHTLSIVESLQAEKQGFTYKRTFEEFVEDNKEIQKVLGAGMGLVVQGGSADMSPFTLAKKFLEAVGPPPDKGKGGTVCELGWALGKTKVFMTTPMEQRCYWFRTQAKKILTETAMAIQRMARGRRELGNYTKGQESLIASQARWRRVLANLEAAKKKRRRNYLVGSMRTAARYLVLYFKARRLIVFRQKQRHIGIWKGTTMVMCLHLRCVVEMKKKRRRHNMGIWRGIAHALVQRFRLKRLARERRTRQLMFEWRGAVTLLRVRAYAGCRNRAATQIQKHARTFCQRDQIKLYRKQAKWRSAKASMSRFAKSLLERNFVWTLKQLAAVNVLRGVANVYIAQLWLRTERIEQAVETLQSHGRGFLARLAARKIRQARRAAAGRVFKAHVEALRWRIRSAQLKKPPSSRILGATRALNKNMGFMGRNNQKKDINKDLSKDANRPPSPRRQNGRSKGMSGGDSPTSANNKQLVSPNSQANRSVNGSRNGVVSSGGGAAPLSPRYQGAIAQSGGAEYTVRPKVNAAKSPKAGSRQAVTLSGRQETSPLCGVWHYSSGDKYKVRRNENGQLCFEELHDSGRKMYAILDQSGEWMQGDLIISHPEEESGEQGTPTSKGVISQHLGDQLGTVRLKYDTSMGMAVLNFRGVEENEWATEIVARKALSASAKAKAATFNSSTVGPLAKATLSGGGNDSLSSRTRELHRWMHRSHQEAHDLYSSGHLAHGTPSAIARAPQEIPTTPRKSPEQQQKDEGVVVEPPPMPPSRAQRMENLQRRLSVLCKPGTTQSSWSRLPGQKS